MKLKEHRFKKNEITIFLNESSKYQTDFFSLFYRQNEAQPKYAFIAPKRTGNATTRNKIRRQLKEAFYKISQDISKNTSLIIIAKNKMAHTNFNNTYNVLLLCLKKKDLLNDNTFNNLN